MTLRQHTLTRRRGGRRGHVTALYGRGIGWRCDTGARHGGEEATAGGRLTTREARTPLVCGSRGWRYGTDSHDATGAQGATQEGRHTLRTRQRGFLAAGCTVHTGETFWVGGDTAGRWRAHSGTSCGCALEAGGSWCFTGTGVHLGEAAALAA